MTAPTFDQLITDAARQFRNAGIADPRQNAMMLMLGAFGDTRAALISAGASPVPKEVQNWFEAGVARRLGREPVQHILGATHFYGLEFVTDARALIPRPDSELIVEKALAALPAAEMAMVTDLGTGTGCLLASILVHRPDASGVGVEASPEAASLARENFARLGLSQRAAVFEGSWTDWAGWGAADIIVSNPPYIPAGDIGSLEPEVRDHDPRAALDGGPDGLDAYREIIRLGAERMKPGAPLVLEIGHDQLGAVLDLLAAAGFAETAHYLDLGGNDRCVMGRAPGSRR